MSNRRFDLVGIPVLALLIMLFTVPWSVGPLTGQRLLANLSISLYFTTCLWTSNRLLWEWLRRRLPRIGQTSRRLWLLALLAVLLTAAATVLLQLPLHALLPDFFQ